MTALQQLLWLGFGSAVLFRQLSGAAGNSLLAMLVLGGGAYVGYREGVWGGGRGGAAGTGGAAEGATCSSAIAAGAPEGFASAIADRREANTERFSIGRFSRLRFLPKNPALAAIARDLRFVRTFDKARYADLLLYMEKFQKTYMYILGDRYYLESYVGTLMDLRDSVAETLYSLVFAVPASFRHSYGLAPYPIIQRNIEEFQVLSRKMIKIVENFARSRGDAHFPVVGPRPYEKGREDRLP
jgi:hypothetical protein